VFIIAATLVCGAFALAGETMSWPSLFAFYGLTGLAAVWLPLRLFPNTANAAFAIYASSETAILIYHVAGSAVHAGIVTAVLITTVFFLGAHSGIHSAAEAADMASEASNHKSPGVLILVTLCFVTAFTAGVAALGMLLIPGSLFLARPGLMPASVILAGCAVGIGGFAALITGLIESASHIALDTPRLGLWGGPGLVTWHRDRTVIRRRRVVSVWDRMGEVLRRSVILMADTLQIIAVAAARTIVNIMFTAVRITVNEVLRCINALARVAVLTYRCIVAGVASALRNCARALLLATLFVFYAAISAGLPVGLLTVAAAMTLISAEETRLYLIDGSLEALLRCGIAATTGLVALTTTWIVLANEPLRSCILSARRSVIVTAPYALIFIALGGWIVGLPGTLGPGRIRVGWVTIVSTVLLISAFVWSQFINKSAASIDDDLAMPTGRSQ
jgi:hypothetical protein